MDIKYYQQKKKEGFNVRNRKDLKIKPNNNSSDFVMPSFIHGCELSCAYCVEGGTMISTPSGPKPVEQIQDGDEVIAFDSLEQQLVTAHVSGLAQREVEELIELEVEGGSIRVSLEHPFLTSRGWVEAQHLTETDEVFYKE